MKYLQFMLTLRKLTRAGWKTTCRDDITALRLRDPVSGWACCPLTSVCLFVTGRLYGVHDWKHAAVTLGFDSKIAPARLIMFAADGRFDKGDIEHQVRAHLRYFLGLPKEDSCLCLCHVGSLPCGPCFERSCSVVAAPYAPVVSKPSA